MGLRGSFCNTNGLLVHSKSDFSNYLGPPLWACLMLFSQHELALMTDSKSSFSKFVWALFVGISQGLL